MTRVGLLCLVSACYSMWVQDEQLGYPMWVLGRGWPEHLGASVWCAQGIGPPGRVHGNDDNNNGNDMIESWYCIDWLVVCVEFTKLCAYPPTAFHDAGIYIAWTNGNGKAWHDDSWRSLEYIVFTFPVVSAFVYYSEFIKCFKSVFQCCERKYVVKSAFLKYWDQSYSFYKWMDLGVTFIS